VPSAADHRSIAARNEAFYRDLCGQEPMRGDWAMTVLFYIAVHEVQAVIVKNRWYVKVHGRPKVPDDHGQRLTAIGENCPEIEAD